MSNSSGNTRQPGVEYPREVPVPEGVPEGWRAVEAAFGETSKQFGRTYVRFSSLDGKHKHIGSPPQVIKVHCKDEGIDPEPMLAEYSRLLAEAKAKEAAEKEEERNRKGILTGEQREEASRRFRELHGELQGSTVFTFPGWKTSWTHMPKTGQTPILYVEPSGQEWRLLKDLEAGLQHRMDTGVGDDIPQMLEEARKRADPSKFAVGGATARETQGTCEIEGGLEEAEVKIGELEEIDGQKLTRSEAKRRKTMTTDTLFRALDAVDPIGPAQLRWTDILQQEDVDKALVEVRQILIECKFAEDTELIAIHALPREGQQNSGFAPRIHGVYYRMPELCEGRPCYQRLIFAADCVPTIACDSIFAIWCPSKNQWQITSQAEQGAPWIAYVDDIAEHILQLTSPWKVLQVDGSFEESTAVKLQTSSTAPALAGA